MSFRFPRFAWLSFAVITLALVAMPSAWAEDANGQTVPPHGYLLVESGA